LFCRCSNCPGAEHAQSEWFVKRFDSTILSYRSAQEDSIFPGWNYTFKLTAVNNEGKLSYDDYRFLFFSRLI